MTVAPEITQKMEALPNEDFQMVVSLIDRLYDRPSNVLRRARSKYTKENPMTMEEIDEEIQKYRRS